MQHNCLLFYSQICFKNIHLFQYVGLKYIDMTNDRVCLKHFLKLQNLILNHA